MKTTRKLIPALAMLVIAAVTMSTASYAWFSMNTNVRATGMDVKAVSEGGIVIGAFTYNASGYTAPVTTAYAQEAVATYKLATDSIKGVFPTSTKNLTDWYHATSASVNDHTAKTDSYQKLTMTALSTGEFNGKADDNNYYYLLNKFNVKSLDTQTDTTNGKLNVTAISVDQGTATSGTLNKALRIAIKCGSATYFFAPLYDTGSTGTLNYYGIASSEDTATKAANTAIVRGTTGLTTQISTSISYTNPTTISVYAYYEGEDENCKSINAVNIDTLTVNITFTSAA